MKKYNCSRHRGKHIESDWHNLSQFVFVWQHGTWFYYHVAPSDYLACVQFCIVKLLNVSILHKTPSCLSFSTSIYVRFQTPINFSFDLRYLCQFVFFTGQSPSPSIHCRQLQTKPTKCPDLGQFLQPCGSTDVAEDVWSRPHSKQIAIIYLC